MARLSQFKPTPLEVFATLQNWEKQLPGYKCAPGPLPGVSHPVSTRCYPAERAGLMSAIADSLLPCAWLLLLCRCREKYGGGEAGGEDKGEKKDKKKKKK